MEMKTIKMPILKLVMNENNPRLIKGDKFEKLVTSIKEFPEMLEIRPVIIDNDNVVLGGNMRLRACIEAGLDVVPTINIGHLSKEKQMEFVIKDNVSFGEWDWNILANEWDMPLLSEWGLETINLGEVQKMDELNKNDEWVGMPDFDVKDSPIKIIINFETESDRDEFQKIYDMQFVKKQEKMWTTWFPFRDRQDLNNLKYE